MAIYTSIGMILSFIPYLILKSQIKKEKSNINENLTSKKVTKNKLAIKYEHYNIYIRRQDGANINLFLLPQYWIAFKHYVVIFFVGVLFIIFGYLIL